MKKLMKKILASVLCVSMMGALLAGCGKASNEKKDSGSTDKEGVEIALVCSADGKNDNGYNQRAVEELEKIGKENNIGVKVVETSDSLSVPNAMKQLAEGGAKLIFNMEYDFDALITGVGGDKPLAEQYPDTTFVVFNASPNLDEAGKPIHKNVVTVLFDVHEGSFLAGYLGVYTNENLKTLFDASKYGFNMDQQTNRKIGYIGANSSEGILVFLYGYMEGASYACQELNVEYELVGKHDAGFADATIGSSFADSFYSNGGNVLYSVAGTVGTGVTSKAADAKRFAIEVDADKDNTRPGNILTSVLKNTNVPVKEICEAYKSDKIDSLEDILTYDVASGGSGITDLSVISQYITDEGKDTWADIQNKLKAVKDKIASGDIVVTNGQAGEKLNPEKVKHLKYSDTEASFAK